MDTNHSMIFDKRGKNVLHYGFIISNVGALYFNLNEVTHNIMYTRRLTLYNCNHKHIDHRKPVWLYHFDVI